MPILLDGTSPDSGFLVHRAELGDPSIPAKEAARTIYRWPAG